MLECGAVDEICRRGRPDAAQLAEARAAVEEFQHLLARGYELGLIEADRRFHEGIVAAVGNPRLVTLYQRAPLPMVVARLHDHELLERHRITLNDHRAILKALERGDAPAAKRVLRKHLRLD